MSIQGWAQTLLEDYSIFIGSEEPTKFFLQLYFRFKPGTKEANQIELKLRETGFEKWVDENGEIVNNYTQWAFLGEFELEPEKSIYSTTGYRKIRDCLNRVKPILAGLEPPLI